MYIDRSLRNKHDGLINELNFKKCIHLKISMKSKFFIGITNKQRKYIIHPDFMVDNEKITDQFIQNLKSIPNKVHHLTGAMKKSFNKQRLETNLNHQIRKISRITDSYGITKYLGRTFNNMEVPLEPSWMSDNFEFSEPDFYKQVTDRGSGLTGHKTYTVPVGQLQEGLL